MKNEYISLTIKELYRIFDILNEHYFENQLSRPIITIQKGKSGLMAWITKDPVWFNKETGEEKYELNICPEYFAEDIYTTIDSLQHENIHYYNIINKINDCNGKIHNKKFKKLAELKGLIVEKNKKYGWGLTKPSFEFMQFIDEVIKPNVEVFTFFRKIPPPKERKKREKKTFKYKCPKCNEIVKAKLDININCNKCNRQFELAE